MVMTYQQKFNKAHGFLSTRKHSLEDVSKLTGYELEGLKVILNNGKKTYPRDRPDIRKTEEEWGMKRVYAAVHPYSKVANLEANNLVKKSI